MQGLDHVAENILSFLDAKSLCAAGAVSKEWARVISEGMLWKKLIERKVNTDSLWKGLADRRNWIQYLFKPKPGESHPPHSFYRGLYPSIIKDIDVSLNGNNMSLELIAIIVDHRGQLEVREAQPPEDKLQE